MGYGMDYVKKYDYEDLNTTLIFMRCSVSGVTKLVTEDRAILCRQLGICHRRSFETSARS